MSRLSPAQTEAEKLIRKIDDLSAQAENYLAAAADCLTRANELLYNQPDEALAETLEIVGKENFEAWQSAQAERGEKLNALLDAAANPELPRRADVAPRKEVEWRNGVPEVKAEAPIADPGTGGPVKG